MKKRTLRRWVKQEKRIIRGLYRAGLLDGFLTPKFGSSKPATPGTEFYWASYKQLHRMSRRKLSPFNPTPKHPFMPEVFVCTQDYWGEADENPLGPISVYNLPCGCPFDPDIPHCSHIQKASHSRTQYYRYLESLPTKRNDHQINKTLRRIAPE